MAIKNDEIITCLDIFHDGSIERMVDKNSCVEFEISILYLAQLINPRYEYFKWVFKAFKFHRLVIYSEQELVVESWSKFQLYELEFLSAHQKSDRIVLSIGHVFDKENHKYIANYAECEFSCEELQVFDPQGVSISLSQLITLADHYWSSLGE